MDVSIKNILLAGIGAVYHTYEMAAKALDEMVKKGELTVEQAKELNEELKKRTHSKTASTNSVDADVLKGILKDLNLATKDDIEELKKRLEKLENK